MTFSMPRLSLSLLDPFQVYLDDARLTNFGTDKVRALRAYLGVKKSHKQMSGAALLIISNFKRAFARVKPCEGFIPYMLSV
jgi:hypothetical protein